MLLGEDLPADAVLERRLGDAGLRAAGSCRRRARTGRRRESAGRRRSARRPRAFETRKCRSAPFFSTRRSRSSCCSRLKRTSGLSKIAGSTPCALRRSFSCWSRIAWANSASRDLAAVELRDLADAVAAAEVVVDAEERERNHDQRENELRDPLVLVDEIKHRLAPILSSRAASRAAPAAIAAGAGGRPSGSPQARPDAKRANSRSPFELAEWTGLEPATPGVTGRYSNQLNYHSRMDRSAPCASGGC